MGPRLARLGSARVGVRQATLLAVAALASATLLGFTSGGGSQADQLARGRKLFQAGSYPSCGFCHSMRSAGTTSPFSDDLDGSLIEDTKGKSKQGIERFVLGYIATASCYDPHDASRCMPKLLFSGADAKAVALFIATCGGHSGRPGCKPVPAFTGVAAAGVHDFQTLGCSSCHIANLTIAIAPSLRGLYGSRVQLQDGKTVIANDAYLIASILTPDADTVKGFQRGLMSSRIASEKISLAQAKALVAYIKTLR